MKKNLLSYFFLIVSVSLLCCNKPAAKVDPITPPLISPVTPATTVVDSLNKVTAASKTGAGNLLLNAYSFLDGIYPGQSSAPWETGTDNWMFGSVAGGDAYKGSNSADQPEAAVISTYSETSTDSYFSAKWQVNLMGIRYSNATINELPLVKDGSLSVADKVEIAAEAKFLRGFYELELAKLWRNVPYIDETVVYTNGYKNTGNPGPIWDKIEEDFAAAMKDLPVTQILVGRPNKYAAEAFLVKTLMFDHKYSQALPFLNDLIDNGITSGGAKYALVHYADNFNPLKKNGPESVFAVQAIVNDGSNGYDGNAGDILNFPTSGPASCCGFFSPSFSLVNAFKTNAVTGLPLPDTYNNSDLPSDQGISSNVAFYPTTVSIDSRLDWTVGRRGIPYLDWGIMPGAAYARNQQDAGPYVNIKTVYYKAAQATTSESYGGWAPNESTSNNYNAIRFADVLLWAAEAEVESGSLQKAEDYINMVRKRAADPVGWVHTYQDNANPTGGFSNTPAANYKVGLYGTAGGNTASGFAAGGQSYARKAVYFERLIELGMEGHRFFDLQRWDGRYGGPAGSSYMSNSLNAYINHETAITTYHSLLKGYHFTAGKNELYPIPQSYIVQAAGKLKQNPGY